MRQSFPPSPPPKKGDSEPPAGNKSPVEVRARALEQAKRFREAAELYSSISHFAAATRCFYAAGDPRQALASVIRLSKDAPDYREAAGLAIRLAVELDEVDFDFDQFIGRYLDSDPRDSTEMEIFYLAGELFENHGFDENAKDTFRKILGRNAGYRDVRKRFDRIARKSRGTEIDFERVVEEDDAFRNSGKRNLLSPGDDLDDDLPPLTGGRQSNPGPAPVARDSHRHASAPPPMRGRGMPAGEPPVDARHSLRQRTLPNDRDQERLAPAPPSPEIEDVYAVAPGFLVASRYTVQACVGHGGMAAVYRAYDQELSQTIALKLFAPHAAASDPTLLPRFKQEVALCRQISHPNVIRLYDLASHGNVRFITMELLTGLDLWEKMDRERDLLRDLGYLIQACEGLQCVHELGIVHRDLKPENLFVTDQEVVKLMDFGVAKRRRPSPTGSLHKGSKLTESGYMAGTPAYMAPEQIEDFGSATHLSDIYSLGVIAYGLFTGTLPFHSEHAQTVLSMHLNDQPAPPSVYEPSIPEELEFIILQLLEKDPQRRIQSCRDIAHDLTDLRKRLIARKNRRR